MRPSSLTLSGVAAAESQCEHVAFREGDYDPKTTRLVEHISWVPWNQKPNQSPGLEPPGATGQPPAVDHNSEMAHT